MLTRRLGDLGGLVEGDCGITASLARSALPPMQRMSVLLKMAVGETAPIGPAAQRARDVVMRMSKQPEIRADLAKSPELMTRLRPLMAAAG